MKATFSINRIGLLFQRYFIENMNREIVYWGIMAIAFMFVRNTVPAIGMLIVIAGAFFSARFFREVHSSTNGINYFMLPATQLEKILVSLLLVIVYYFGMMTLAYVAGNLVGTLLNNILAMIDFLSDSLGLFHHSELKWVLFQSTETAFMGGISINANDINMPELAGLAICKIFGSFIWIQSIFMLGSLYFKRNPVPKTLLSIFTISFIISLILGLAIRVIFGGFSIDGTMVDVEQFRVYGEIVRIFTYLLMPFMWVVSYFRLTEKQV